MDADKKENNNPEALTSIHDKYTLSNTNEGNYDEVEKVMINTFLQALAEISMSIAVRKLNQAGSEDNRCEP